MILILVALKAESQPLGERLAKRTALTQPGLAGYRGELAGLEVALVITGMGPSRSRISAARAMDALAPVELVLTSGVAGGLRDDLAVGQVVVSQSLLTNREDDFQPEQMIQVPTQWLDAVTAALDACKISHAVGPTITSRRPLMTAAAKQQAYRQSGAISVDMESAAIALEAQRRALPFIALRTILDTSREDVVGARLLDQNGTVRPLAAIRTIIANPPLIIGAVHLVRNLRRATHSLASALEAALPRLELT